MSGPDALLTLVTLGVADLERSIAFYEALGFKPQGTQSRAASAFSKPAP